MEKFKREGWRYFKHKLIQLMGGLFMEKNDEGKYVVSLGRVSFWMLLMPAIWIWLGRGEFRDAEAMRDISPNHANVLMWVLAYNLGKKGISVASNVFSKNGGSTTDTSTSVGETAGS